MPSCVGNACDAIIIKKNSSGCVVIHNTSNRSVEVNCAGYLAEVYAKSEWIPRPIGYPCFTSIQGITANYTSRADQKAQYVTVEVRNTGPYAKFVEAIDIVSKYQFNFFLEENGTAEIYLTASSSGYGSVQLGGRYADGNPIQPVYFGLLSDGDSISF